jgi:hypothetical protein
MLNLFQHLTCKVYTRQAAMLMGCRNKFGMTVWIVTFMITDL